MIKNETIVNEEKFLKFNSFMFGRRSLPSALLGVVGIVMGVAFIVAGILIDNLEIVGFCLGGVFILLFGTICLLPKLVAINAKKVFAANADKNGTMTYRYEFDEDGVTVTDAKGRVLADGEYDNLELIVETPAEFYLLADVRSCVGFIVDKVGFVDGDAERLAEILKKKNVDYVVAESKSKDK